MAVGGNLLPETLLNAYAKGIFPWYSQKDPILWWNPDPRLVLFVDQFHASKNLRRLINRSCLKINSLENFEAIKKPLFYITINDDFKAVIEQCSIKRGPGREDTWISPEISKSYTTLHEQGYAHSVEVWDEKNNLIGGLYGVALGQIFFGESMFSHRPEASKLALYWLCEVLKQSGFFLIDCQIETNHLKSLGAVALPRKEFLMYLKRGHTQGRKKLCLHCKK